MDADDALDEFDDASEGVSEILAGIVKEGREGEVSASRESVRRMSRTSEEPRGVLGGG